MSYEYAMSGAGALGYSDPRATCSEISGGETRCFRPREASAAASNRCRTLSQSCQVSGEAGTNYCCPQFGTRRAPTGGQATTGQEPSALTQAVDTVKGILGFGVGVPGTPSTDQGESIIEAVTKDATNIAFQEVANAAEEAAGGAGANPAPPVQPWYQQYQTPILIGAGALGLMTIFVLLVARKR